MCHFSCLVSCLYFAWSFSLPHFSVCYIFMVSMGRFNLYRFMNTFYSLSPLHLYFFISFIKIDLTCTYCFFLQFQFISSWLFWKKKTKPLRFSNLKWSDFFYSNHHPTIHTFTLVYSLEISGCFKKTFMITTINAFIFNNTCFLPYSHLFLNDRVDINPYWFRKMTPLGIPLIL